MMLTIKPSFKRIALFGFVQILVAFLAWSVFGLLYQVISKSYDLQFWLNAPIGFSLACFIGFPLVYLLYRNRWVIVLTDGEIMGDSGAKLIKIKYAEIARIENNGSRWLKSYKIIAQNGQALPIVFFISKDDCQLIFDTIATRREQSTE